MNKPRPGRLVLTKDGLKGRTFNDDALIDGKVIVHLNRECFTHPLFKRVLCDPKTLTFAGFID